VAEVHLTTHLATFIAGRETYLWQIDLRNYDAVQRTGGVLWRILRVSAGVILVLVGLSRRIIFALPWHAVCRNGHFALGCG
jgi:hypothetical protein